MIVADTSAMLALLNREDRHHEALLERYRSGPSHWVLPWATLPEIDYLVGRAGGASARLTFLQDVAAGAYLVEWGAPADLERAAELSKRYRNLDLGLVDATVMAVAERIEAQAIATLDLRRFGAVELRHTPRLLPRDG